MLQTGKVQEVAQRKKEERERIQTEIIQQRDTWEKRRKIKIKREGGWSGKCWGGILLDPPDPGPNGGKENNFLLPLPKPFSGELGEREIQAFSVIENWFCTWFKKHSRHC